MRTWIPLSALSLLLLSFHPCRSGEIGFIEDFALARDRSVPLGQLIPGTEDYYYFHGLHYQNTQQFDKVDDLLPTWIKRHGHTARVEEIQNRQALLTFERNPQRSLERIRQRLNLEFNHQRETIGFRSNLPIQLDQRLISRAALTRRALRRHRNLQGFEDSALNWLPQLELTADQRRHLVQRLDRPDHANLPRIIVEDLAYRNSRGFGSADIHRHLLLSQLNELLELRPDLLNQTHFVNTYLSKLRPGHDVDWRNEPEAKDAYLERLWSFVRRLAPAHNSLKAHVLYHQLLHDRARGAPNKQRFMTYIALPRNVSYINADYMKLDRNRRFAADLTANFRSQTLLPPVGDDERLVRSYLHHFFIEETTYKPYERFINDIYLKHHFAETKIVNGLGDSEQWYSMLPPARYQALKQRIDLDFAPTNRQSFAADEPVSLDLYIKNVRSLIVKVFEINTTNYYRQTQREIDTDVNLDGLIANREETFRYDVPDLRRVKRHFEFPSLQRRGVYVIDFIGNGKSSRALIRKGQLRYLARTSTAGHLFTVLDERNQQLENASIWLDGHEYTADEGQIAVPFTNQPRRQPIVLSANGFSTLDHFAHQAENYSLNTGFYVDRESLLANEKAQVIVRPSLRLNATPVTFAVLEDVKLTVTSTDLEEVATSKDVGDFQLHEDRESIHEFQVPDRTESIKFTLWAKVQSLSQSKKVDLVSTQTFHLNGIEKSDKVQDLHLARIQGGYVIDVLGKNGERKPDQQINVTIKHRDFRHPVTFALQTNANGRLDLGELADISNVTAQDPYGTSQSWLLRDDAHSFHRSVHGRAGETIQIPYMGDTSPGSDVRGELSLLELRGNTFFADRLAAITARNGLLNIRGLPAGDYDLVMKRSNTRIRLRVSPGEVRHGYVLGKNRQLELRGRHPLQIGRIEINDNAISARLRNTSEFTRVHVFATRYRPAYSPMAHLGRISDAEPYVVTVPHARSDYVAGRNIGDEIRYIIDRKYAKKYPGNMLDRPSALLSPWAVRSTATDKQRARAGGAFAGVGDSERADVAREMKSAPPPSQQDHSASLDFLAHPSVILTNLAADDQGILRIERSLLGTHQQIHIVACDPLATAYRSISLTAQPLQTQDRRLADGLPPEQHFTQQKQTTILPADGELIVPDITTARFEAYDSLARVYAIYVTLTNNPQLLEFHFLLDWPQLSVDEKRTKFSKYACHELAFFIKQKDPAFFRECVKPYLEHKKDKTFLDHWMLGHDLRPYLRPWRHARLNIVERILLAQRIENEAPLTARHVKDLLDLIPPDVDRTNLLFDTVVKGNALDTADALGIMSAVRDAQHEDLALGIPDSSSLNAAAGELADRLEERKRGQAMGGLGGGGAANQFREPMNRAGAPPAPAAPAATEPAEQDEAAQDTAQPDDDKTELSRQRNLFFERELGRRQRARQFYQKLDKTQEWAENNYYKLPIEQQNSQLVTVNQLWNDYAQHDPDEPFYSVHFAEASRNFTEMMFALAVLDLSFDAADHATDFDGPTMKFTAGAPLITFHEEIKPARDTGGTTPILVSQNFFQQNDRYRFEDNQRYDKYVTDEFVVHTVYGCQVVVTNPTSSPRKLELLLQIPQGALPALGSQETRSVHLNLAPYNTQTHEYFFYFPEEGSFTHYPVHVSQNQKLVAFAEPFEFQVVREPTKIDRQSWAYISQHGAREEVLQFLREKNLHRIELEKIAFRMSDERFFETVTELLAERHIYNHTLWSYAIKHGAVPAIRQYLQHADDFVTRCGMHLDSPLLTIRPVARRTYQHLEYRPLVNARAHQLGRRREILNDRFLTQYHETMALLSYRRALTHEDLLAVTYYLLLQDRVQEALEFFGRIEPDALSSRLQYDYFDAYLAFYLEDTSRARAIADQYIDYPVDGWRNLFAQVQSQLDEIEQGAEVEVIDTEHRSQRQTQLASTEPSFDFEVESFQVRLEYQNLDQVTVKYYLMDIELLFSRNPFVQQFSGQFSFITPNRIAVIDLPQDQASLTFDLPGELANQNVLVEITAAGETRSKAYYSNSLSLQLVENYGHLRVVHVQSRQPVTAAYVKVYAQMQDGSTNFYKDGYTDLRGRFDYASLNTNELDFVRRFSLLVLSDRDGAVVREARPPKR